VSFEVFREFPKELCSFPNLAFKRCFLLKAPVSRLNASKLKTRHFALVVNSGLKILLLASSGTPTYVSSTLNKTLSLLQQTFMVMFPPLGMACHALAMKLVNMFSVRGINQKLFQPLRFAKNRKQH
jgi:hypothetical protein